MTTPGVQTLAPEDAVPLPRAANDVMAKVVRQHPDRFQGFATLPTGSPADAALELKRAVCDLGLHGTMLFGRTGERNLDHPDFFPILAMAAQLRAPIYLHPQSPPPQVRAAYYEGLGSKVETVLATGGIGWHYEAGLQVLRLILSGTFDKLPDLQIILGHWGEVVLFYLDRIDLMSSFLDMERPMSDYFKSNIYVTPGGILSQRYLRWAIEVLGEDRILFATDYPFNIVKPGAAPDFLSASALSDTARDKVAFGNWQRLCADIRRG